MDISDKSDNRFPIFLLLAAIISFALYFLTCFRTFTWWDSSEYSLAALTLGVPHPPGSLLTVIFGWIAAKLPLGINKFFLLNLLAALVAALIVYFIGNLTAKLFRRTSNVSGAKFGGSEIGAFLGALTFGVAITTWYYAIRFTPYMTTAFLTIMIVASLFAWRRRASESNSHLWLGLVMLLFGLDFSIHRTNLLMLPGFLIWIAILRFRTFLSPKNWISGVAGLALGLIVQLLLIPIAAARPFINFNDPSTFSRFWDYITLQQYGGGWLIGILPRKAPFLSVQVADYIRVFGDNFANGNMAFLGFLPFLFGMAGLIILFRRNWKLALGLTVLFISAGLGSIIYFNLPANYFRSIDRHYLPSIVIFSIFIAYGVAAIWNYAFSGMARVRGLVYVILIFSILMPVQAIKRNFANVDGSRSYFASDTARNFLISLPKDAILISQADIDTYTLWCLQVAEHLRPDVTVCNISLMNTPWFIQQIQDHDPNFPVRLSPADLATLNIIPWHDSTFSLPVSARPDDYGLPKGTVLPTSISLTLSPTVQGQYLLIQDQMILKIIAGNNWRRPICFSSLLPEGSIKWLYPYLRLEGLFKRLVPLRSDSVEIDLLRKNLIGTYTYRGYTDPAIPKEEPSKWLAWNYSGAFLTLSSMQYYAGDTASCHETIAQLRSFLSPDKLSPPPELKNALADACE